MCVEDYIYRCGTGDYVATDNETTEDDESEAEDELDRLAAQLDTRREGEACPHARICMRARTHAHAQALKTVLTAALAGEVRPSSLANESAYVNLKVKGQVGSESCFAWVRRCASQLADGWPFAGQRQWLDECVFQERKKDAAQ